MTNLKRIPSDTIEDALDKAKHYRLLNEPMHAESICLDVLEVDSDNQQAITTLLLALTDQFPTRLRDAFQHAESLVPQLVSEYDKHYYEGIVYERWAIVQMHRDVGARSTADCLNKAMRCYEAAEKHPGSESPDPILRWNTCARLSEQVALEITLPVDLKRDVHGEFGDDVPPR